MLNCMREKYISVDIESSGPIPGEYSLLTIGACLVDDDSTTFAASLKPLNRNAVPEAMSVSGLSLDELERTGQPPAEAMAGVIVFFLQIDTLAHKNYRRDNHLQNRPSRTPCAFGAD